MDTFIAVPSSLVVDADLIGEGKTKRWYAWQGTSNELHRWLSTITQEVGPLIPLIWVPAYVSVSRPAVAKRALNGRLTVFSFEITTKQPTLLGGIASKENRDMYALAPQCECDNWRAYIERIAEQQANNGIVQMNNILGVMSPLFQMLRQE